MYMLMKASYIVSNDCYHSFSFQVMYSLLSEFYTVNVLKSVLSNYKDDVEYIILIEKLRGTEFCVTETGKESLQMV